MDAAAESPPPFSSFRQAVEFLESLINYEKCDGWKYSVATFELRRMRELLAWMGDPQEGLPVVHVAGTKGKGSTAAMVESVLRAAGLRTGLHTSPHLVSVCERLRVDARPVEEDQFLRLLNEVRDYVEQKRAECRKDAPTYFEITSALALLHFRRSAVDWAVVEVGLGGRLDSTNVVSPRCCVITPIGFDHMDKLGDTPAAIAGEKAGIMKPGVPVVLARQGYPDALEALRRRARELECPCWEVGREVAVENMRPLAAPAYSPAAPAYNPAAPVGWLFDLCTPGRRYDGLAISLLGAHQVENCATAIAALEVLRGAGELELDPEAVRAGVGSCRWPARVELLERSPALVLDSAHTAESIAALLAALEVHFPGRPVRFVFGCSADKDAQRMVGMLAPRCAGFLATQADSVRAMPAHEVARVAARAGIGNVACMPDAPQAAARALEDAAPEEVVCVTGSLFLAGEVRLAWERGGLR